MALDKGQLTELYNQIDSVLYRAGNNLTVLRPIVLEHSQEGGQHRVRLMDALRTAVNGTATDTTDEDMRQTDWYSNTDKFIEVATMAVGQFNR